MFSKAPQKGQALILIALAAIGLFAFTALAIDGSRVYSDKRNAQNAADTAALAGALAYSRNNSINNEGIRTVAQTRATSNGYDSGTSNDVTVESSAVPPGGCLYGGKDIKVTIVTHVGTTFARVIGRDQVTTAVTATSRVCNAYYGPPFPGNVIVALGKEGIGFDAHGNTKVTATGGGILSNSTTSPSVWCGNNATLTVPSITAAGPANVGGCYAGPAPTSITQIPPSTYKDLFPPKPACNGTATYSNGQWHPQAGANGSNAKFDYSGRSPNFAPGLYCITDSPGPYNDNITGTAVTFYITDPYFTFKLTGTGNGLHAEAPTDPNDPYKGVLMYLAPQFDANGDLLKTQALDVRGNGATGFVGTIIAPSAQVTMYANSNNTANNSQIIAYNVDFQGGATVKIDYQANKNLQVTWPCTMTALE